jgi:hypothetical protein
MPEMLVVCRGELPNVISREWESHAYGFTWNILNADVSDIDDFPSPEKIFLFIGVSCVSYLRKTKGRRVVEIPSLDNVRWTTEKLLFVGRLIKEGTEDLEIRFDKRTGQIIAESLVPF